MAGPKWSPFPYEQKPYTYSGAALEKAWARLHRGDCEPFPSPENLAPFTGKGGKSVPGFKGDLDTLSSRLQDAWRAFHRGDFREAVEAGSALGPLGASVANKAAGVYATYLEEDEKRAVRLLTEAGARGEEATRLLPGYANAWYFMAFALGRYAQRISVVKALSEGVGTRVRKALDTALEFAPQHADAHTALGLYHAEIIDKVGALAGGITYGASREKSVDHFAKAAKLFPESPIVHMEHAHGLLMLYGDKKRAEAIRLYRKAAESKPADAMERLDAEQAKAELE
jgi:tetratricopeptide (TPR) repeat protein